MSHTDTFGYIYESVVKTANTRVSEESQRVQAELFARLEGELLETRRQRDGAMQQFRDTTAQLDEHLQEQKKFKLVAFSGFCMGMVSLSSIVLSSFWEKR
jgi:hypothetical protein